MSNATSNRRGIGPLICRLIELVEASEARMASLAHITLEHRGICLPQIHDHQAIDHVGEFSIEIERDQFSAHLRVLLYKDGEALAIFFDIGDWFGQFIEIAQQTAKGTAVPAAKFGGADGVRGWIRSVKSRPSSRCSK